MTVAKLCRSCHRFSSEARFPPLSKHLCLDCGTARKQQRAERIAARGPRVVSVQRPGAEGNPKHLAWIRSLRCVVWCPRCLGKIASHHVRGGTDGGTARKPADRWAVPLCADRHHAEGHHIGWATFEAKYGVDLRAIAAQLAVRSPHIRSAPDDRC